MASSGPNEEGKLSLAGTIKSPTDQSKSLTHRDITSEVNESAQNIDFRPAKERLEESDLIKLDDDTKNAQIRANSA